MQNYTGQTIESVVEKKQSKTKIFVSILIVLFILIFLILLFSKKQAVTVVVQPGMYELKPTDSLSLSITFATIVDKNMSFFPKPNAEYIKGEIMPISVGIYNFKQTPTYEINLSEDLEIRDSNNNVIFSKKDYVVLNEKANERISYVKFNNFIPTDEMSSGFYVLNIKVIDKITGLSAVKSKEFRVIERSKEINEKIINLSSIIAGDLSKTKLIKEQLVFGPDGNIIEELSFNQTITNDLSKIDLNNVYSSFKIPERFDAGNYTVEIKYINLNNGEFISIKDTVEVIKKLEINSLLFANSIDENFVYELNPENSFRSGQTVYVYLRLVDFSQPEINGKYNTKFSESYYVYDDKGKEILKAENNVFVDDLNDEKKDAYEIKNAFVPSFSQGKYIYKAVFKDLNSGQIAERDAVFYIY